MRYTLKRDDIPLLSQWIKKFDKSKLVEFFGGEGGIFPSTAALSRLASLVATSAKTVHRTVFFRKASLCSLLVRIPPYKSQYQKIKTPTTVGVFIFGGEGGIRTLETLLTPTRFPIVRARPTTRLLHVVKIYMMLNCKRNGGPSGTRTQDRPVMSRML